MLLPSESISTATPTSSEIAVYGFLHPPPPPPDAACFGRKKDFCWCDTFTWWSPCRGVFRKGRLQKTN